MRMRRNMIGCAIILASGLASAQAGTLTFHVQDATGSPIPNADVRVSGSGHLVAHNFTDQGGEASLPAADGSYDVVVQAQGFATLSSSNMVLSATKESNFTLSVASYSGPVVAVDDRPLDTQSSSSAALLPAVATTLPPESPVARFANSMPWEYGALVQGGNGLTEDRNGFHFMSAGVHVGKVLTSEMGHGPLKGNFEYAVEVYPFWQSYTPKFQKASCFAVPTAGTTLVGPGLYCSPLYTVGGTYTGVTITPIILRWNFTHGKKFMPWAQAAGGSLWTNHKYPAFGSSTLNLTNDGPNSDASVWNFTPQGGVGFHYFVKPARSVDFSANAVHISSASLGDKNPGVNASVQFTLGYTWWKK